MQSHARLTAAMFGLALAVAATAAVPSGPAGATEPGLFPGAGPIATADMAEQRGGFLTPSGFLIRFGIDASTYVDGRQVAGTALTQGEISASGLSLNHGPLGTLLSEPGLPAGMAVQTMLNNGLLQTQIRNTVDNQVIQQVNRVSLDLFNLPALRGASVLNNLAAMPGLR